MNTNRTYHLAFVVCLAGCCGLLGSLPPTQAAGRNQARATPDLLVDLARDYGLNCRGQQTAADVAQIKALLHAALRLDPQQAQARVWLYELASLADQPDEAAELLAQLVAADPANLTAFANWLQTGPRDVQTLEQRQAWLAGLLDQQQRSENRALIHTHLARLAWQQSDRQGARRHLDLACELWPECPDAVLLELELATPEALAADRLAALLRALRANPARPELAWEVGLLLDECAMAEEALPFYEHARDVQAAAGPAGPLPSEKLLQLSRNALARGQRPDAVRYAQEAGRAERNTYEAQFFLYWLLDGRVRPEIMQRFKGELATALAAIKDPDDWPVTVVSEAAWFYCTIDTESAQGPVDTAKLAASRPVDEVFPNPVAGWAESVNPPTEKARRALTLAENAARRAPGDVFAARVLGWAQALNGQTEAARQTLTPIAGTDPYAAYRLAKLLRDAGDEDAPARLVSQLACMPPVGRARELLDELDVLTAASQPAEQRFPEVVRLLADFDRQVLEFPKEPGRFLEAAVSLDDPSPAPGEPWWAVFSLTNRSSFPITLGPDWMVNPVFLLSFRVEGDRQRDYPHLMTVSLDQARVIRPGQTVSLRRTIDVGPLRTLSRRTPQQLQSVSLTAILDAELTPDGEWQPSITGQRLRSAMFVRLPANTDPEVWHARFSTLRSDAPRDRFRVLEVVAELLGEHQRARSKGLSYTARAIPADPVQQALHSALGSESWEIRVRALDALQAAGLDRTLIAAAQECLKHPHWLVRMMAVRLLARQGEAFAQTARQIADDDQDELVRAMADSFVQRWSTPSSGPATTQPADDDH